MGAELKTWIDVARGTCIILVTLLRVTLVADGNGGRVEVPGAPHRQARRTLRG